MNSHFEIHEGDAFEVLKTIPSASVDACVTDPPYGIRFMGQTWDGPDIAKRASDRFGYSTDPDKKQGDTGGHRSIAAEAGKYNRSSSANREFQEWTAAWAEEIFRILKPGGHLVSFASCRTYHRMATGVEDAGFEIRDQLAWVFGSGFPKSHNLSGEWNGWGTALKPGWEPIVLGRKPIEGTVAANVAKYHTGALNIDGCRLAEAGKKFESPRGGICATDSTAKAPLVDNPKSRWPANLCHDGSAKVTELFPESKGQCADLKPQTTDRISQGVFVDMPPAREFIARKDCGSAARFFYCAKATQKDRDAGLEDRGEEVTTDGRETPIDNPYLRGKTPRKNIHPTVKPTELMRWLCRLITPPGGIVIDPFTGSGSTGRAAILENFRFIGIEREAAYAVIARARIAECVGPLFAAA